jgi:riboflavin kinase / FMN adenylyltransferase
LFFLHLPITYFCVLSKTQKLKIFKDLSSFKSQKKTVFTLGTFDGVHIGHQKIIEKLVHAAKKLNAESLVLTFFPHPRMVIQNDTDLKLLNTIDEKSKLLSNLGLDNLVIHPFDKEFSRLSGEDFVKKILIDVLNIQKIIIGHDHRFGRNRTATIDDLIYFGEKYGFEVEQISAQEINDVAVSSTKIRNALAEGEIETANNFLGYNYFFSGIVEKGKQLGRTIGFPTANLVVNETYKRIPKQGVYVVKSILNNKTVFGMMNIGTNPTIGVGSEKIEIHFFDFQEDLYDKEISISVLHRLRSEQKFDSIEILKNQLKSDAENSRKFIEINTI